MLERPYATEAETMKNAILALAADRDALENFEHYLSIHFREWLGCYVRTPGEMCGEFKNFAEIYARAEKDA